MSTPDTAPAQESITVSLEWAKKLKEEWRDISCYEALYQVSNHGRIRSVKRSGAKGGLMKLANYRGYNVVSLTCNNKQKNHRVGRLVALAFLGFQPSYIQVNHKNGKKGDDYIENIEWCTQKENMRHAFEVLGKDQKGERNGNSKITEREANLLMLIKLRWPEVRAKEFAGLFGVSTNAINSIWNGKRFKHLHPKSV